MPSLRINTAFLPLSSKSAVKVLRSFTRSYFFFLCFKNLFSELYSAFYYTPKKRKRTSDRDGVFLIFHPDDDARFLVTYRISLYLILTLQVLLYEPHNCFCFGLSIRCRCCICRNRTCRDNCNCQRTHNESLCDTFFS